MESGRSTALCAVTEPRLYVEGQRGTVESGPFVWDSPSLDHFERLRALEEAILR